MTGLPGVELDELLTRTRYLLLDFDGPVCGVFAGQPARTVVMQLLSVLARDIDTPSEVAAATDPFDVLRFAATLGADIADRVERQLCIAESNAVMAAEPTPYATEVIDASRRVGRPVAIVSNNSAAAVERYLTTHAIDVDAIAARTSADSTLLKPSPHLVIIALRALGADPAASTLIGDSPADIVAAQRASISSIGYANKPGKRQKLTDAGALVVVDDLGGIAHAATAVPS
jgi:phosphoglycolate phosphatase-like HAD superfamily hydrolase